MNQIRRFLFENLNIQGAFLRLDSVFESLNANRDYPPACARVLGEMVLAALYLAQSLKASARLSLQLKAASPVSTIFVDARKTAETGDDLLLRAMAKPAENCDSAEIIAGKNDYLLMNLELPDSQKPYQSVVPLSGATLPQIFENFMKSSEQTEIFLKMAVSKNSAAALFFKKLPDADLLDADGFNRLKILAETITDFELLNTDFEDLMPQIFVEDSENLRVFAPQNVAHHCPYDPQKILQVLKTLKPADLKAMLAENGKIHVHDDICNHDYFFEITDFQ